MSRQSWPDTLQSPQPTYVQTLLRLFWEQLALLPDLLVRQELILAEQQTTAMRNTVIEMMLALNGIRWPNGTRHLNTYLGASQRQALERTLTAPAVSVESWIGRAVALLVIYRWYAPQLVAALGLDYPQALEDETLAILQRQLPDWPLAITTE